LDRNKEVILAGGKGSSGADGSKEGSKVGGKLIVGGEVEGIDVGSKLTVGE
jgi:hypothetical protein